MCISPFHFDIYSDFQSRFRLWVNEWVNTKTMDAGISVEWQCGGVISFSRKPATVNNAKLILFCKWSIWQRWRRYLPLCVNMCCDFWGWWNEKQRIMRRSKRETGCDMVECSRELNYAKPKNISKVFISWLKLFRPCRQLPISINNEARDFTANHGKQPKTNSEKLAHK